MVVTAVDQALNSTTALSSFKIDTTAPTGRFALASTDTLTGGAFSAMEFLISDAGLSPEQAKAEIANISLHPTEYLAYELGAQEITKLRDRWQSRLGKKFDLRDFHKVVMFNLKDSLFAAAPAPSWGLLFLYAFSYALCALALSSALFAKKEF